MDSQRTSEVTVSFSLKEKMADYALLIKLRLTNLVVFSAVLGYSLAATSFHWLDVCLLILGGFLVTGSSNGFNQVMERDVDGVMERTKNRPIPSGRMSVSEAMWVSSLMGVIGILILWFGLNELSGVLGALALFSYVFVYTPLKKQGPISVFVGAFPGAIPPMLGYIAFTGSFDVIAGLLFAVQFVWQFPHFWSIAWKLDSDYKKVGYIMLPSRETDKASSFQILIYSLFLIPITLSPLWFGVGNWVTLIFCLGASFWVAFCAGKLHVSNNEKDATKLMFATFIYLPVVQMAYLIAF